MESLELLACQGLTWVPGKGRTSDQGSQSGITGEGARKAQITPPTPGSCTTRPRQTVWGADSQRPLGEGRELGDCRLAAPKVAVPLGFLHPHRLLISRAACPGPSPVSQKLLCGLMHWRFENPLRVPRATASRRAPRVPFQQVFRGPSAPARAFPRPSWLLQNLCEPSLILGPIALGEQTGLSDSEQPAPQGAICQTLGDHPRQE